MDPLPVVQISSPDLGDYSFIATVNPNQGSVDVLFYNLYLSPVEPYSIHIDPLHAPVEQQLIGQATATLHSYGVPGF